MLGTHWGVEKLPHSSRWDIKTKHYLRLRAKACLSGWLRTLTWSIAKINQRTGLLQSTNYIHHLKIILRKLFSCVKSPQELPDLTLCPGSRINRLDVLSLLMCTLSLDIAWLSLRLGSGSHQPLLLSLSKAATLDFLIFFLNNFLLRLIEKNTKLNVSSPPPNQTKCLI